MKRILIIDDDSAIHLIASAALQRAGAFKIGFARDGQNGLERARATRPDLILLDAMLPDINGDEVLQELRRDEALRDTQVIFLTAKGADPGFDYRALGAQGLITKPFDPDRLAQQIREVLDLPTPSPSAACNGGPEHRQRPAFPAAGSIDELRRSFVKRGRKEVKRLLESLGSKFDADAARRLAHLWVGRGGTLGHPQVSVVARRLELRLAAGWSSGKKWRVHSDLRDVQEAFEVAWKDEKRRARRAAADDTDPEPGPVILELDASELKELESALPALPAPDRQELVGNESSEGQEPTVMAPADLPGELRELLSGRTVALFGFDECDIEAMREVFPATDIAIKTIGLGLSIRHRDELAAVDVAVINVASEQASEAWRQVDNLAEAGVPCLAIGSGRELLGVTGRAGTCEFLMAPWCAEEVLLRCFQLVSCAVAESAAPTERPAPDESNDIVIADDDPTITALVEMTLREAGMTCHVATGGEDALELIRAVRPKAVVLDVNMPQMDGFEVLAALRNDPAHKTLPVVMLTALRQETDVVRGFRLGADDYVVKPFNPMELSARLERLVRAVS